MTELDQGHEMNEAMLVAELKAECMMIKEGDSGKPMEIAKRVIELQKTRIDKLIKENKFYEKSINIAKRVLDRVDDLLEALDLEDARRLEGELRLDADATLQAEAWIQLKSARKLENARRSEAEREGEGEREGERRAWHELDDAFTELEEEEKHEADLLEDLGNSKTAP